MKQIVAPDGKAFVFWFCPTHSLMYPNNLLCGPECSNIPKIPVHVFYEPILDEEGKRYTQPEAWMIEVKDKGEWRMHALCMAEPTWVYDIEEPELRVVKLNRGTVAWTRTVSSE